MVTMHGFAGWDCMTALQTLFGVLLQTCEVGAGLEQNGSCSGQLRPAPADLRITALSATR